MNWPARVWEYVKGSPAEVVRSFQIPRARVIGNATASSRFEPRKHYFSLVINEMFLTKRRQWWTDWDPMVLIVTEFLYDGKPTAVPFVVGPSLIKLKQQEIPDGMALTDTRVAGFHPYTGGSLAVTVILARVKRTSHAHRLLQFLDSVASAVPAGAALAPNIKVAGAVLDGVEALFGMNQDTVPIAGHRWEYNDGMDPWMEPGFFALINSDEREIVTDGLWTVRGRLRNGSQATSDSYRANDFLLYSLHASEARDDYESLPFHQLFQKAKVMAATNEDGSWDRAKANLVAATQEMLSSPDLTFDDALRISSQYAAQLKKIRTHVTGELAELGPEDKEAIAALVTTGIAFPNPDQEGNARREALKKTGDLLKL